MDFLSHQFLALMIFLPAAGALLIAPGPARLPARWTALTTTLLTFCVCLLLLLLYDAQPPTGTDAATYAYRDGNHPTGVVQLAGQGLAVPFLPIRFVVGLDGLSLPMVLLTTFISVIACVASWRPGSGVRFNYSLFLLLESAALAAFLILDLFLFFVFFQIVPILLFALGRDGKAPIPQPRRTPRPHIAACGAVLMAVAVIAIYRAAGSFDLIALPRLLDKTGSIGASTNNGGRWVFIVLMAAFLIRLPAIPFHGWITSASEKSCPPGRILIAALIPALSGYGMFRIAWPLFPQAARHFWLPMALIGVAGILHGAMCAMAEAQCLSPFEFCLGFLLGLHPVRSGTRVAIRNQWRDVHAGRARDFVSPAVFPGRSIG